MGRRLGRARRRGAQARTSSQCPDSRTSLTGGCLRPPSRAARAAQGLLEGKYDDLPEMAFYMVGPIEEASEKAKDLAAKAAA